MTGEQPHVMQGQEHRHAMAERAQSAKIEVAPVKVVTHDDIGQEAAVLDDAP